eukprot:TRINITY_DN11023_c0_g3_i2.p4 TRINITY_DN11023_c0_g3~~TRINITY_DN11023_c0_g3_i2.p4  ORF type:complete len:154 (+),score=7.32 TRINITY_DN11023_c0_g3_i2:440-901(+)
MPQRPRSDKTTTTCCVGWAAMVSHSKGRIKLYIDHVSLHVSQFSRRPHVHEFDIRRGVRVQGFTTWAPHDGLIRTRKFNNKLKVPFHEKVYAARMSGIAQSHFPFHIHDFKREPSPNYLGIFRHPGRRLVSAFNYGRHAYGMNKLLKARMRQV